MSEEKVVSLAERRNQKENEEQDVAVPQVPEYLRKGMDEASERVQELIKKMEEAVVAFADGQKEKMDITIPLEAMVGSILFMSSDLDRMVPEDELESHFKVRDEMTQIVDQVLMSYIQPQPTNRVLSHDIYFALGYAFLRYIIQHRSYSLHQKHLQEQQLDQGVEVPHESSEPTESPAE